MVRFVHFALIIGLIMLTKYLYDVKYAVANDTTQITRLKNDISREKENIQRLKEQWAFVNRPEHLQILAEKHLELRPLALHQIGLRANLPEKQEAYDDPIGKMLDALERANRETTAASIKPKPKPVQKPFEAPKAKPQSLTDLINATAKGAR
jgi:hypothetical protein